MRANPYFGQGFVSYPGQNDFTKSLSLLGLVFSMVIFCGILFFKVEVWAQKQKADVLGTAAQMDWEGFLYSQTAREVFEREQKQLK